MSKFTKAIKNLYYVLFPPDSVEVFKKMGVKIGKNVHISNHGVIIDWSHSWLVNIGDNVRIAPNVHILTHDGIMKNYVNYSKIALVEIKNNALLGAGSLILPGVTIGENSVIGAGSVVIKDIPDNCIAAGNPAKVICSLDEYIKKQKLFIHDENCFDESYTLRGKITEEKKKEMIKVLEKHKIGFVR